MKQNHPNSQLVQTFIDNQNTKLLNRAKASHGNWLNIFKNFTASVLIIVSVGSVVTMAKGCTAESQSVGGAK